MFLVGALLRYGSVAAWIFQIIFCMGGCLGCDIRHELITSVDEPFKVQNNHPPKTSKAALPEDFWTASTCEMDISAVKSCESMSSTSTLTQMHDSCSTKPSEFVNHGLIRWNQNRKKWIGNKKPENRAQELREPKLSWNATYDSLLSSNKPFRRPIPLGEMIDFLVDIWEQEGMYD
ncbi:hypothetical protein ACP275_04G107500 [Erythranthe tilingii]